MSSKSKEKVVMPVVKMPGAAKKSQYSRSVFLKTLESATKENFSTITSIETEKFILEKAGSRIYLTFRQDIRRKAKSLGIDVPPSWARKPFPVKETPPVVSLHYKLYLFTNRSSLNLSVMILTLIHLSFTLTFTAETCYL
jgi:hypothetical protein